MSVPGINAGDFANADDKYVAETTRLSLSQKVLVTDIISEGPIEGLVAGGRSVFANNDPIHAVDLTSYAAPRGQECVVTSGSKNVSVTLNNTDFSEQFTSEYGNRYLVLYGAYGPIKATTTTEPQPSEVFQNQDEGVVKNGWSLPLTRTSGTTLQTSFNGKGSTNWASIRSAVISDGSVLKK